MSSNPYAPPAGPPSQPPSPSTDGKSAEVHRAINAVLILGSALFGALALLVTALQLAGLSRSMSGPPAGASKSYVAGYELSYALWTAWSLVAFLGGPFVAYGLLARRPWGARIARSYWIVNLFSCCLTLPAIYGVYSTTRPAFRGLFERR